VRPARSSGVGLRQPGDAFAAGSVVAGRYHIEGRIGEGGIAEVLAARDADGRELAVKVLHSHLARHELVRERFRREMELTRCLAGPGIVQVYGMHEHAGRPFFAMERLRGNTLRRNLRAALEPEEARRIAREICRALQRPHAAGAVHRDLKPENVFLTAGGVKLLDFGLSRSVGDARLTASSRVLGTPGYIAPEVWEGDPADARADLYAVGAILFEMLAGRKAFPAEDPFAAAAVQRDPPDLRDVWPAATDRDAAIVGRALAPDPEERFLTAAQLIRALDGRRVPAAPRASPRLSAGGHDVVVHEVVNLLAPFKRGVGIRAVLRRLGARAPRRWRWQLAGAGEATLVTSASRSCAEAIAALCAEHAVPATVRAARDRSRAEAWLARRGTALLVICNALLAVAGAVWLRAFPSHIAAAAAGGALFGYMLSWGLRPALDLAPLRDLPARTSAAGRFAAGLLLRATLLERAAASLPRRARAPLREGARCAREAARSERLRGTGPVPCALLERAAELDQMLGSRRR
jgi:Protein kinase domain